MDALMTLLQQVPPLFGPLWPLVWVLLKIIGVIAPLLVLVAYTTYGERRIMGFMHLRRGPNRVGPFGLLQPAADGIKLILKEVITPARADKSLYFLGPILAFAVALVAWVVVPFADGWVLANVDAGVLLFLAITSFGVYGVIIAGWASNSKYPFLAAMRAAAQMVSYEVAMGLALICVLMISNSLNLTEIVRVQQKGVFADMGINFLSWNWLPLLPMFVVYLVSGLAETNRAPFDVVEGESEIVAGHMMEYSGMGFALFFLAEYANMALVSAMTAIFFLGGWSSPVGFLPDGFGWLALKILAGLVFFIWTRATFPRYRYDQIMRLGWKVFVPLCLAWILVIGIWMMSPLNIWK
ncbi:NADH-quinone oxidoreductase subunit NuoH [Denitratisoma oestradiolicum]|uniref:NADH-quinone oxidoreductase subunit H n=1 Tax=Denitratisoma oestradiolicum TaxID=311182 RepID=A0A6S6XQC4_9PROT|nr:NADH-quinone oxidoreductase subunit NuoH [Denitratisoma oestradiolicum]TWO79415.1 NADH-quinone oxidoreductase subunit H [Denitratisoma oestradiolicum]CAB1368121.1 NADH:ubiquinone oxidoreductase, membrane subunit H [Denitratisoma oestradiolicum]